MRIRFRHLVPLLSLGFAVQSPGQGADDEPAWRNEPTPAGPVILERMREAMPKGVIEMRGVLMPRGKEAAGDRKLDATLVLDWHGTPSRANFELRDSESGEFVAGFLVERSPDKPPVYRRVETNGVWTAAPPDEPAWTTEFTWRDLAFDYLWWPRAESVGVTMRSQRRCYLVDVPNPNPQAVEASVRLWVDDATYALLQAQTRDAAGHPLRELSVKSLRRVALQWMVEDIEVRNLKTGRRTLLRILPPPESPEPEGAP